MCQHYQSQQIMISLAFVSALSSQNHGNSGLCVSIAWYLQIRPLCQPWSIANHNKFCYHCHLSIPASCGIINFNNHRAVRNIHWQFSKNICIIQRCKCLQILCLWVHFLNFFDQQTNYNHKCKLWAILWHLNLIYIWQCQLQENLYFQPFLFE